MATLEKHIIWVKNLKEAKCRYCALEFWPNATRIKNHLLRVPGSGISLCDLVPVGVKNEIKAALEGGQAIVRGAADVAVVGCSSRGPQANEEVRQAIGRNTHQATLHELD